MKILELRKNGTNSNGITLVALVISIVVLLILATVSVQVLTGDNGLITKTETAVQSNKDSQEEEKIKLAVAAAQVTGNGTITTENLNNELRDNFSDNGIKTDEIQDGWSFKSYKIDKNGKVEKLLPKEYKQIEYIESTGSQFIDTNLKLPFSINILAKLTTTNEMEALLGCQNGKSPYNGTFIRTGAWGNFNFLENRIIQSYSFDNNIHRYIVHFYKDNASVIIDDIPYGNITTENQYLQYTVYLFALNAGGTAVDYSNHFQIYECKIYSDSENTNLIRNFIPCKSNSIVINSDGKSVPANTKGLYDLVEGKFYTNKNTDGDDFTAGPEI